MIKWFRYCGVLTVFILWFSILTAINKIGLDIFGNSPLSSLGTHADSKAYFSTGLILAALSLFLFVIYLNQHYKLTTSFWVFLCIGQVGQVIAAIVPYGGEQPARAIHTVAALTLAFSIPLMLWNFAKAQKMATRKRANLFFWVETVAFVIGIGMFSFIFKGAPFGQILPAVAFHSWLIHFSFYKLRD